MKTKYFYPDVDDRNTLALIKKNEPSSGYWEISEKKILDLIKHLIEDKTSGKENLWLLDAGCGTGRLLPEFERYFNHILAIDPDCTQIEKAEKTVKDCGFEDKVTFKVSSAEELEWKKESIDVVLCSHILQHVPTDSVQKILSRFHEILRQDGLLFITTTHSRKSDDYFAKDLMKGSEILEKRISKEEFNSLINNDQNILPIHFFSANKLANILMENGFKVLDCRSYHVLSKSKLFAQSLDRDDIVNASDQLRTKFGRDIFLVSKKLVK